jgi:hypothetical protein
MHNAKKNKYKITVLNLHELQKYYRYLVQIHHSKGFPIEKCFDAYQQLTTMICQAGPIIIFIAMYADVAKYEDVVEVKARCLMGRFQLLVHSNYWSWKVLISHEFH